MSEQRIRPMQRSRFAAAVFRLARRLMPAGHADWIQAMETECWQIGDHNRRARWALGCLSVAVTRRIKAMVIGDFRISRWVLAPELLLCFGPLGMGWFDVTFGSSGVVWLNAEIIQQFFLNSPRGTFMLIYMYLEAVLGLLGPIACVIGAVFVVTSRPALTRKHAILLISAAGLVALLLTSRLVERQLRGESLPDLPDLVGFGGALLMFSILPAAGIAHMYYLGRESERERADIRKRASGVSG